MKIIAIGLLSLCVLASTVSAGGYVDSGPTIKDVLVSDSPQIDPPPKIVTERVIEKHTETIKEVEKPISPRYGLGVGFSGNVPTLIYSAKDYSLEAGMNRIAGTTNAIVKLTGPVAEIDKNKIRIGAAIYPVTTLRPAFALIVGAERYLSDRLSIYADLNVLALGNNANEYGVVELGGKFVAW